MIRTDKYSILEFTPRIKSRDRLHEAPLDAADGFLMSRIDGGTTVSNLSDITGLSPEQVMTSLRRMEALGLVEWLLHGQPADFLVQDVSPAVSAPAEQLGQIDKDAIDEALSVVTSGNLWQILGLSGSPSSGDIKAAYFSLSKRFHPDRFFGRELGEYAPRLQKVFLGIKQAYQTLSDAHKRAAYEARVPPPCADIADSAAAESARVVEAANPSDDVARKARLEARRQEIIAGRRRRAGAAPAAAAPSAGDSRADGLYQAGLAQLKSGDYDAASKSFQLALTFSPQHPDYVRLYEEASSLARNQRASALMQQGQMAQAKGDLTAATRCFAEAAVLAPEKVTYGMRAAEACLAQGDSAEAQRYIDGVLRTAPSRTDALELSAAIWEACGRTDRALQDAKKAQALEPTNPRVNKLVRRLQRARE